MGVQLLILVAMGLASLYMMHLLAMDYMRIRRPVTRAVARSIFRTRRDLNSTEADNELKVNWDVILSRDPLNCLQSLMCQISAGAEEDNSSEALILKSFVELTYSEVPNEIKMAFEKGLGYRNQLELCKNDYPLCIYSAKTMLGILKLFTERLGN